MDSFEEHLTELLVHTYRSIETLEQQMLESTKGLNLTINEFHLLEAVGYPKDCPEGRTMGEISEYLNISMPSVTLAVNKLVKKGYVEKRRSDVDGRVVHVRLTRQGIKGNRIHQYFHRRMVISVSEDLTELEKQAMVSGMEKLNQYFAFNIRKIYRNKLPGKEL